MSRWQEVDRLISEDKYQAALEGAETLRREAQEAGDAEEWARGLIKETQLRIGLAGYETAVRTLKEQPWPEAPRSRLVLELFYARTLVTYVQAYSWEVAQRERVVGGDIPDLKRWTQEQLVDEAHAAYGRAWTQREAWGAESLGTFAEYIEQNDYPARIRGTLRDAVTYLWVEMLSNSGLWKPAESSDLWRLDTAALLAEGAPAEPAVPEMHPLEAITALLGDLEAWHLQSKRPEAAFEARLERLRRLSNHFDQEVDKELLRQNLQAHLDQLGSQYSWWAMGQAFLAEQLRQVDRVAALEVAREGVRLHPDTPGGKRCRHFAHNLEAPAYSLEAMGVDGPGKRSIRVQHKNLDRLYFRAYSMDLLASLKGSKDYNLLPDRRVVPDLIKTRKPVAEWTVDLPPTPDLQAHFTYVTPPLEAPGLYVVAASARQDFAEPQNRLAAINMIVSDLVLLENTLGNRHEITLRSGKSGKALAGLEVGLYQADWRKGHQKIDARITDASGRVDFTDLKRARYFATASHGDNDAFLILSSSYNPPEPQEETRSLVYTDRSVYRPGQTVHFKVVAYKGIAARGRFETLANTAVTVELVDANGEAVARRDLTTNHFGSTADSFEIPTGRLLGGWYLRTSLDGNAPIQVEEYKRPTFEVNLGEPSEPLRLNRPARLTGEARYYFGLPVTVGEVAWRISRDPIIPPGWWWFRAPVGRSQTIASGTSALAADGTFAVEFTPEADERLAEEKRLSYYYTLHAELTDEGGETRSAQRAFRVGFVTVEANISSPTGFFTPDESTMLTVVRRHLAGAPAPGEASYRLLSLEVPKSTLLPAEQPLPKTPDQLTEGDRLRPRWHPDYRPQTTLALWPDGDELASGTLEHGASGKADLDLGTLQPGAYRLRYRTTDPFGAEFETQHELLVIQDGAAALPLPALLEVEKESVSAGDTLRLLVASGLKDQELVLEIDGPNGLEERRLHSNAGSQVIELPISLEHRGGLWLRLRALRDHQLMRFQQFVAVPWDDRRLEVDFATFRDRLRPGTRETFRITVRDPEGEPPAHRLVEVLATMYDRSLDLFAPHQPPKILSLYPSHPDRVRSSANLRGLREIWYKGQSFPARLEYPNFRSDQLKLYDGYNIGGPGIRSRRGMPMAMEGRMLQKAQVPEMAMMADAAAVQAESAPPAPPPPPPPPGSPPAEADAIADTPADEVRTNFAETAFFEPQLRLGADGTVSFEFEVPDAVTEWSVWAHAIGRDLRGGSVEKQTRTVKELLVRPYLPRFFREGDQADLRVVIQNAGEEPLEGHLDFHLIDPETERDRRADFGLTGDTGQGVPFRVEPGGSTRLAFPVTAPKEVGPVAVRAVARAGEYSDGELRPLPVLPSRLHLVQSRFAAVRGQEERRLHFDDLAAGDDPTLESEQLVVTLDAQLFYGVLSALPYLVDYPYQCTEQTLNRFLSSGILASLYDRYPAVSRMAEQLEGRSTRLETWDDPDPNRTLLLEESPWLQSSRGGNEPDAALLDVLDPELTRSLRDRSLAELAKSQTSLGAFPWWPGGPPSPYMTLYMMLGFSRALEFGVEVPRDMVVRGWQYLHSHYVDELARKITAADEEESCCWQTITFLNYVLSNYPDASWTGNVFSEDDRNTMLDFSFRHWRRHSPRLKGFLALTLHRAGRTEDAQLVWDSVMDSSRTTRDEGTFWAPEDRAWLWYNDTIESHAFALRTLTELEPGDERAEGLVQWLFLNKKLNHWKSTRATAEVIYALTHYLSGQGTLAQSQEATVRTGTVERTFRFEPEEYTGGKNQVVIPGESVGSENATTVVSQSTDGLLFASATWHFATDRLPEQGEGDLFTVERHYFKRQLQNDEWVLEPLRDGDALEVGDQLEVQFTLRARHAAEYVHLRDPRGAGLEPESTASGYRFDLGIGYYEEIRDSATNLFFEWLPAGEYTLSLRQRASVAGTFRVGPATLQSLYASEFNAYSSGAVLTIDGGDEAAP